jgi:hypothetical protein
MGTSHILLVGDRDLNPGDRANAADQVKTHVAVNRMCRVAWLIGRPQELDDIGSVRFCEKRLNAPTQNECHKVDFHRANTMRANAPVHPPGPLQRRGVA